MTHKMRGAVIGAVVGVILFYATSAPLMPWDGIESGAYNLGRIGGYILFPAALGFAAGLWTGRGRR